MEISYLPTEYVINATRKVPGGGIESDFFVRAVKVKNTSASPLAITSISFDALAKGSLVKQVTYPDGIISDTASRLGERLKRIPEDGLRAIFGDPNFWDIQSLAGNLKLEPGKETGLLNNHFQTVAKSPVDECVVTVSYSQEGKQKKSSCSISVKPYTPKHDFIFPLKGMWWVHNNYNVTYHHRLVHSQEFALDFIQWTEGLDIKPDQSRGNEDYPCFGKEVYAIAAGEVIESLSEIPDNPKGFGSRLPAEQLLKIKEKYGFASMAGGNYVILRHAGGICSFYAHMQKGSVCVKKGEQVKQGQVVGKIGNTGHSDGPHLHFQIMDGADFFTARCLPASFTNLVDIMGTPVKTIDWNTSTVFAK